VQDGLALYPEDPVLAAVFARTLQEDGFQQAALTYVQRALELAPADAGLTTLRMLLLDDEAFATAMQDYPENVASADPRVLARGLLADPGDRLFSLFAESGGIEHVDLTAYLSDQAGADLHSRISSALSSYDGHRWVDRDWDGLAEERYTYRDGSLLRWQVDADGDGHAEVDFRFDAGRLSVELSEAMLTILYAPYPYAGSVVIDGRTYRLAPRRFTADFVSGLSESRSGSPQIASLALRVPEVWPREEDVASVALSFSVAEPPTVVYLRQGDPAVRKEMYSDRTVAYEYSGGPDPAIYVDLANTGRFELIVGPGEDRGLIDADGDGSAEALIDFPDQSTRWDLDGDGIYELSTETPADVVLSYFSGRTEVGQ
jgi:hypothetical protein